MTAEWTDPVAVARPELAAHGLWDVEGGLLFEFGVYAVVALAGTYLIGAARIRRRAPGRTALPRWRAGAFLVGVLVGLAVVSPPVDDRVHDLFFVHMLQHLVLAFVVAPLIVLGRPVLVIGVALAPGIRLPRGARRWAARHRDSSALGLALAVFHVCAWYIWHLPGPYVLALENPVLHTAEHVVFVLSGMTLAWYAAAAVPAVAALLGTAVSMVGVMPLAALLVLSSRYWYAGHDAAAYGLSSLEDQQLGGALMWFPGLLAYLGAVTAIGVRRLRFVSGVHQRPPLVHSRQPVSSSSTGAAAG